MHPGKYDSTSAEYVAAALVSDTFLDTGENWVEAFENRFAHKLGARFGISVNSATSGLHAALIAAGVKPGDEVISPGLTVIMDAFATVYTGASPVFCDVNSVDWNIDIDKIPSLITKKTKAIISVSWFGFPTDNKRLREICDENGLILIDDSAETISTQDLMKQNWQFAHLRVYSFESKKHFSTGGEGGMVLTDDPVLAAKVRKAAGLGYKHLDAKRGRTSLASRVFQNPAYERFDSVGFNYRMTPITAAIGLAQLERIEYLLQSRVNSANLFDGATNSFEWLKRQPKEIHGMDHAYYAFGLFLDSDSHPRITWQEIYDLFVSYGGHGFYANCLNPYLEPVFRGRSSSIQKFDEGLCPNAEKLQKGILALKTNYLDMQIAREQSEILHKALGDLS